MSPHDGVHLDGEVIALMALGERPGTPEESAAAERHLATCGQCSSELDELSAVARTARSIGPDHLVAPPPEVWAGIQRELVASAPGASSSGTVVDLGERRRRRTGWLPLLAAACVGVLVGGGATFAAMNDDGTPSTGTPTVIASAALDPLEGSTATGSVDVVQGPTGPQVVVDVSGLTKDENGFYEVWLLDKDAKKLIALGVLDDTDKGVFTMPPGVSMNDFPIVDVSLEPDDGDPNHSHNSVVRGQLPA